MTTQVQTLVKDRLTLNTATTTANLSPGDRLTDSQLYQTLNSTGTNSDTVQSDPGQTISYTTGFSDWVANNPGLAIGGGLLLAWGLYQLFTSKKRR